MNFHGPLTLRCPKCKVGEDYRRYDRPSGRAIHRTGLEKDGWRRVKRGRHFVHQWQVWHQICGHRWWTTHRDAVRLAPLWSGSP